METAELDASTAPGIDTETSTRSGWVAVGVLFILAVYSYLDRNLVSLLIVPIQNDLALTEIETGTLIGAAFALSYTLANIPFGWALDRYHRPLVIYVGVLIWSLGTAAAGLTKSYWSFFAARSIVGAGEAALFPGAQALFADLFPKDRLALPNAVFALAVKIGAAVSFAIGGLIATFITPDAAYEVSALGVMKGWQLMFIVAGLPGVVLGLAVFIIREPRKSQVALASGSTGLSEYGRFMFRNRKFYLAHHLAVLPMGFVIAGTMAWTPAFLMRVHGLSIERAGTLLALALSVGPIVALPLHGWIVDRLFRFGMMDIHLRYLAISLLLGTPFLAFAYIVPNANLSIGLIGMFYVVACGYLTLPTIILQIGVPRELRGKAIAVLLAFNGLVSSSTGPIVVAATTDWLGGSQFVGYSLMLCTAIGLPLASFLFWVASVPALDLVQQANSPENAAR